VRIVVEVEVTEQALGSFQSGHQVTRDKLAAAANRAAPRIEAALRDELDTRRDGSIEAKAMIRVIP
jgi:hypothetical protein